MRLPLLWLALVAAAGAPTHAAAALWSLNGNLEARSEANDNPGLAVQPGSLVISQSVTGAVSGSRQTERTKSSLDLGLTAYRSSNAGEPARTDSRVAYVQSWSDVVDGWSFALSQSRNSTFDTRQGSADVALGRGQRRASALQVAWSRQVDERLSVDTALSGSRTGYDASLASAIDFQNASLSADASWRMSPIETLRWHVGYADFRTLPDRTLRSAAPPSNRSTTRDVSLGWQRSLDEVSSVTANLGLYRTRSVARQDILVCPQPIDFCLRGLVSPVVAQVRGGSTQRGIQYSGSYRRQVDEVSDLVMSASRAQSPSGAGVVLLGDTLALMANRAFTDRLSSTISLSHSRTLYQGVPDPPRPGYQRVSVSFARRLTEDLGLQAGWDWSRSVEHRSGASANSNSISVTLKYDGFRMSERR